MNLPLGYLSKRRLILQKNKMEKTQIKGIIAGNCVFMVNVVYRIVEFLNR